MHEKNETMRKHKYSRVYIIEREKCGAFDREMRFSANKLISKLVIVLGRLTLVSSNRHDSPVD